MYFYKTRSMFYFNPVEGVEGWKTQNKGQGSLYIIHITSEPTIRNNTHSPLPMNS
jgi:hypothetical protein